MTVRIRNKIFLFFFIVQSVSILAQNAVIKTVDIQGNKYFDKNQYLNWVGINVNQRIFPGITDTIKSRISLNLIKNGFHFFEIQRVETDSLDSASVKIRIEVKEDNPTEISEIQLVDIDSTDIPFLQSSFEFLKGEILTQHDFELAVNGVLDHFEENGYPFTKVTIKSVILNKDSVNQKNFAVIKLAVEKGNLSRIDKVDIRGNTFTNENVIIRELRISKGEIYSQKRIDEFPKRINRLRFFEPVTTPQYYINSKGEGVLVIEVKEKQTNNFDGIIGYIPGTKENEKGYLTGLINISLRNLFGTGRAAALRWNKFGRNSQELELKYLEPWLFNFPFNIGLNLFQRIQDTTYVQRKFNGEIEYLATEDISASLILGTESVIPSERTIPVFTVFNSSIVTTGLNLKIDTRDDPYSPTSGLLFINSYSFSRKTINGPLQFITPSIKTKLDLQRIAFDFDIFFNFFARQVLAFSVNGRELRGPSFENSDLFRLGGTSTLRGYREEQFLGSRILWTNFEYRFLLTRRTFAFVFFDTGYYLRNAEAERNILKAEDFLYGYGLGLNLETGLGILAVSFALGQGDSFTDGKIHFGLVNEF
ncbi:MAG: BamA/TamA family outer membrane protein [Ignavibacterium album]|uniref:BamA/OMP85 family outer membrane protein n=1 Tax=Ignavibacterium album TaxID=591197 RepID=UPI0026EE38A8|nr:outer membrane protein assembly factor [Ignavibacterium album]MCX8104453.1 BamA/TamA family outer membrane protein [Ignavibacterium album]